jgi:hypothetical protein
MVESPRVRVVVSHISRKTSEMWGTRVSLLIGVRPDTVRRRRVQGLSSAYTRSMTTVSMVTGLFGLSCELRGNLEIFSTTS